MYKVTYKFTEKGLADINDDPKLKSIVVTAEVDDLEAKCLEGAKEHIENNLLEIISIVIE